eukprot:CAMPEP_0179220538 /NCGR_PEP_ID=MMETSP0797-20121207/5677_1 /TAXON_ID=47934 /ORGANISM="Dinophysis acuminata, Strain DAEP01" /LENGTH=105 /DNA_ID=CAMNT_0020927193 /DNA_START=365 /DNA_END=679 /DNA_ORIENTATION=+
MSEKFWSCSDITGAAAWFWGWPLFAATALASAAFIAASMWRSSSSSSLPGSSSAGWSSVGSTPRRFLPCDTMPPIAGGGGGSGRSRRLQRREGATASSRTEPKWL